MEGLLPVFLSWRRFPGKVKRNTGKINIIRSKIRYYHERLYPEKRFNIIYWYINYIGKKVLVDFIRSDTDPVLSWLSNPILSKMSDPDELHPDPQSYYVSKKFWPNLYSNLRYKMGQDFLDKQFFNTNVSAWKVLFYFYYVYSCVNVPYVLIF